VSVKGKPSLFGTFLFGVGCVLAIGGFVWMSFKTYEPLGWMVLGLVIVLVSVLAEMSRG
jgi:hypothetical protein